VPRSVEADNDTVTLEVKPPAPAAFPVGARIEWMPAGELGNGWFAYGVDRALRRSTYSIEGRSIDGLGCASEEHGELGSGEVEISRQVAAREGGCPSLIETGVP
jgi:hypothetical protein